MYSEQEKAFEETEELIEEQDVQNYEIDTTNSNRKIWLVKVPDFLMEKWTSIKESDVELGSVRIYESFQNKAPRVTLYLSKENRTLELPQDYEFNFIKNPKPNNVFSELNSMALSIEGRIEHECHLKPTITEEYRKVMKERNLRNNKHERTIQVLDPVNDGIKIGMLAPINETNLLLKKKKHYSPELKKERLPKNELLDLLFNCFEKYEHWTLKGLIEYTKQPIVFLKELLNEIAVYNKRGPLKSTYELKPEYKTTMAQSSAVSLVKKNELNK